MNVPAPPPDLDAIALRTRRLDMAAAVLGASIIAILDLGPGIAKRGFAASDLEIAFITSGHSLGLLCSFFISHLASQRDKLPLVFWPEVCGRLMLCGVFFVTPSFALGFIVLHVAANTLQQMTLPARITIYRLNYPSHLRGRIVGRNRQVQLLVTVVLALGVSMALDWGAGEEALVRWLGDAPIDAGVMVNLVIPALAAVGILGSMIFRLIPVREARGATPAPSVTLRRTFGRFLEVWRRDRAFRRYEAFFLVFGFANLMSMPLTQIHAVDVLGADYFDLALINVVIIQGFMALTLVFWGKLVDRLAPTRIRGVLNLIFAVDFLAFALAPSLEWVYIGRIFRGIAIGGGTLVWMLGPLYYARTQEDAPIYLGIHSCLTGVRWLIAPFAGVWLKDLCGDNARLIFFLSFLVIVITAVMMIREPPDEGQDRGVPEAPMPAPRTTGA